MAAKSYIKLTNSFADDTTRSLEIGPLASDSAAVTNVKTNINAVNQNLSDIEDLYLSDSGAKFTGITAASVVTSSEREINLNVQGA